MYKNKKKLYLCIRKMHLSGRMQKRIWKSLRLECRVMQGNQV
jgi:hypothetical protein